MELSICTWASTKPGLIKGNEGSGEMPLIISMEWILPSRISMEAGDKVLDRESTRLPLIVNGFMDGNVRRIRVVYVHEFTAGVENSIINREDYC
jgi:hypothetical protein